MGRICRGSPVKVIEQRNWGDLLLIEHGDGSREVVDSKDVLHPVAHDFLQRIESTSLRWYGAEAERMVLSGELRLQPVSASDPRMVIRFDTGKYSEHMCLFKYLLRQELNLMLLRKEVTEQEFEEIGSFIEN